MAELEISEEERRRLEDQGDTAYGESFPLGTCEEVRHAVESYGRAPVEKRAAVRRAVIKRHRELHCDFPLPQSWQR